MIVRLWLFALLFLGSVARFANAADWPQWRGPDRTGVSPETGLAQSWPVEGPPLAWKIDTVGIGFSTPAVAAKRIYVMGNRDSNEWIFALDATNQGKLVWEMQVGAIRNEGAGYPGPRSTPTSDGKRIYALGINGDLLALDSNNGKIVWRHDLVADFGGAIPNWGYSESVLIDGNRLLCTPGGSQATIVALDKRNGAVLWKSPVGDGAGYSSIIKAELAGRAQYVQFTAQGVIGVAADTGELLWRYNAPANGTADISTPLSEGDFVFAASGYGTGGGLVSIRRDGKSFAADQVFFSKDIKNQHGGVLFIDGYLYGANDPSLLSCLEFKTGTLKWSDRAPGKCSLAYADGRLYARSEVGKVSLVEANPAKCELHGQFDQPERSEQPSWPHPVIANGQLLLRDQGTLLVYDIRAALQIKVGAMFEDFAERRIAGEGVEIFARIGGSGPPLLLLHGYPQSHICWHKVAPLLAESFTVVACDLRGYGDSDKPPGDERHETYSKRRMAADMLRVMAALGFDRFCVAGHDRGGRVAHRLALDYPQAVEKLAVLDIAPTLAMYRQTDMRFAMTYFHWFFLVQPYDFPERLIGASADYFLLTGLAGAKGPNAPDDLFTPEAVAEYLRTFCDPRTIHASCEDYRASATIDLEHDEADLATKLKCPLLVLWGTAGGLARCYDVPALWRERASELRAEALPGGHFLPEEFPSEVAQSLRAFFSTAM